VRYPPKSSISTFPQLPLLAPQNSIMGYHRSFPAVKAPMPQVPNNPERPIESTGICPASQSYVFLRHGILRNLDLDWELGHAASNNTCSNDEEGNSTLIPFSMAFLLISKDSAGPTHEYLTLAITTSSFNTMTRLAGSRSIERHGLVCHGILEANVAVLLVSIHRPFKLCSGTSKRQSWVSSIVSSIPRFKC